MVETENRKRHPTRNRQHLIFDYDIRPTLKGVRRSDAIKAPDDTIHTNPQPPTTKQQEKNNMITTYVLYYILPAIVILTMVNSIAKTYTRR